MDLLILRKKIDGFRMGNGQLRNVSPELLLDLREAWEHHTGSAEEFRREVGMQVGTLRRLLVESKKLNHVLASAEAVGMTAPPSSGESQGSGKTLELVYDGGKKIIRFPDVGMLIEFLKRAA